MNRELDQILSEELYTIKSDKNIFLESETGLPNNELLDYELPKFVKESMEHLKNEIVVVNYKEPLANGHKYNLLLDCVLLKRQDYEQLKNIIERYEQLYEAR